MAATTAALFSFICFPIIVPNGVPPAQADDTGATVATVGTHRILQSELDAKVRGALIDLETKRYELRKSALDSLIDETLIDQAAATRGVSTAELLQAEVDDKVVSQNKSDPIGPQQVKEFYERVKGQVGDRSLDDLRPRIEMYLKEQRKLAARAAFLAGLRKTTPVAVKLRPPTVEVGTEGPSRGPANAPVTIVEFSDFQCPFCKKAAEVIERVMKDYDKQVRLVYRHYPLPFHSNAKGAAQAAVCAERVGKFWPYHDLLFSHQQALGRDDLANYAREAGIDEDAFTACLESDAPTALVAKDAADGEAVGVSGTPAFFINGRPLSGAQPYEAFKEAIDDALARLRTS